MISIFGILAGMAAIEQISQGSTRPAGLLIQSWPNSAAFAILTGAPALTVLPNLLGRTPRRFLLSLARIWLWIMAVGVAGYLALRPGTVLLYYFAGVANDTLVYALTFISLAALILSLPAPLIK